MGTCGMGGKSEPKWDIGGSHSAVSLLMEFVRCCACDDVRTRCEIGTDTLDAYVQDTARLRIDLSRFVCRVVDHRHVRFISIAGMNGLQRTGVGVVSSCQKRDGNRLGGGRGVKLSFFFLFFVLFSAKYLELCCYVLQHVFAPLSIISSRFLPLREVFRQGFSVQAQTQMWTGGKASFVMGCVRNSYCGWGSTGDRGDECLFHGI